MNTSAMMCVAHCYHATGVSRLSLPAQHEERCCHCGNTRYFTPTWGPTREHGPFAPGQYTLSASKPLNITVSNKVESLGDPLLDVFFGKTPHVLPTPAVQESLDKLLAGTIPKSPYKPADQIIADAQEQPACKQEAKAKGFSILPHVCRACGKRNTCPAGKP